MTKSGWTFPLVVIIVLLLLALMALFQNPGVKVTAAEISYTQFLTMEPHLRDVTIRGDEATGHDDQNRAFAVTLPHDPAIATRLAKAGVNVLIGPAADGQSWLTTLLVNAIPLLAYLYLLTWPLFRVARSLDTLAGHLARQGAPPRE